MRGGNKIVGVASIKGSPGATSTAFAIAATWPQPVVLVEADLAGGDLAYRCRAAHGGVPHDRRSILTLAAAAHAGLRTPEVLQGHSQRLSCGVDVVTGCRSISQARGLSSLWTDVADVIRAAETDVIVDLGRIKSRNVLRPLTESLDVLLVVSAATLASVLHTTQNLPGLAADYLDPRRALGRAGPVEIVPVLVGPDSTAEQDCSDLDQMLRGTVDGIHRAAPMPYDADALSRLEQGERAKGRLGRTLLLRRASQIARALTPAPETSPA